MVRGGGKWSGEGVNSQGRGKWSGEGVNGAYPLPCLTIYPLPGGY